MSRITHDAGGGVTAGLLEKAASTTNTDTLTRHAGEFESIASGRSKFSISPDMVRGTRGPEDKVPDFDTVSARRQAAEKTFLASIRKGIRSPEEVIGGLSPMFGGPLGSLLNANPYYQLSKWAQTIDKSFSLSSPLGAGLVPYDLVAPTLLIYPVFSPLRNRIPRPQGQGKSHEGKVITAVQGSRRKLANPTQRISISEFPGGGSFSNWPNQLPGSGSQTAVDVTIPYKFFGLTEAVSWLAQFSGQGFDDIAALASLVLLQETMLAEERSIIGSTGHALTKPKSTLITSTQSTPASGFTALSGYTTKIWVRLTAVNYYGETASTSVKTITPTATKVTNLVLPKLPPGALAYNIYVGTGTADPGTAGSHLFASAVGATNFTLSGALPTATATPPTADTGTSKTTDYEGMASILSGHAAAGTVYPSGYQAGYYNAQVATTLSVNVVANALQQVYDGTTSTYFADPSEIWAEATDMKNLSLSLANTSGNVNYDIFINQDQVSNVTAGVAVSQFANPVTRSTVKMTVHPYFPQGTVMGLSYTLPQVQTNVSNVWENVMVQDYISINWPVVDVTFRYSLFFYGTLWSPAPQYNFMLQGVQKTAAAGGYS